MIPPGDLLVFFYEPRFNWQVVNVSQLTGQKIAGSALTSGKHRRTTHCRTCCRMCTTGDLLVFFYEPRFNWQVVNVSQLTGQKIAGLPLLAGKHLTDNSLQNM